MDALAKVQPFGFHGDTLQLVPEGKDLWVVLKPFCNALEIQAHPQQAKLATKAWAVTRKIRATGPDGKTYEYFGLHIRSLGPWLLGISVNKVAEHVRPKLVRYQKECADVLFDHFFGPREPVAPVISLDLVREERHMVRERRLSGEQDLKRAKFVASLAKNTALSEGARGALIVHAAALVIPDKQLTHLLPVVSEKFYTLTEFAELLSDVVGTKLSPQKIGKYRKGAGVDGGIEGVSEVRQSKSPHSSKNVEQLFITARGASMIARELCVKDLITPHAYECACEAYDWPLLSLVDPSEMN